MVVYEDEPSPVKPAGSSANHSSVSQSTEVASSTPTAADSRKVLSSSIGPQSSDELSEHDEENDPIVFSFGPYGDNLLPRMASFHAGASPSRSPLVDARAQQSSPVQSRSQIIPRKRSFEDPRRETAQNHIINQLAFSARSSTPLSTIFSHLPSELVKKSMQDGLSVHEIRAIIKETKCIGEVAREGKDAAGKPLESEYYYIPEFDGDENRKEAVVNGLRKPGLRACRKQHKVRFIVPFFCHSVSVC
jgi:hypothetical protein